MLFRSVEISKCGSINKAAQKLFLSQSGISTAVRELEQELGIRIFARSNRGVEFTQEGKEFLSYAISLLEQKHRIEGLYKDSRDDAPMRFSVSCQRYPFCVDAFLRLLDIAEDGQIDNEERPEFEEILTELRDLVRFGMELEIFCPRRED